MNKFKLFFLPILLVIPMTASALWWNPFTWKIFQRNQEQTISNKFSSSTVSNLDSDLISCNNFKYNKCPVGQSFVCPENGDDGFCRLNEDEVKTPKLKDVKVTETMKVEQVKIPNKTISKSENFSFLVIDLSESLVKQYLETAKVYDNFDAVILKRKSEDQKKLEIVYQMIAPGVAQGVNIPNDLAILMSKLIENEIEEINGTHNKITTLSLALKQQAEEINRYKEQYKSISLSRAEGVSTAKELMSHYDTLQKYIDTLKKFSEQYTNTTDITDTTISKTVTALQKNADYYSNKQRYDTINSSYQTALPTIPKITTCSVSNLGAGANIMCY